MAEMQSILKRKAEKLDDLIIAYSTEMTCFVCEQIPTPSKKNRYACSKCQIYRCESCYSTFSNLKCFCGSPIVSTPMNLKCWDLPWHCCRYVIHGCREILEKTELHGKYIIKGYILTDYQFVGNLRSMILLLNLTSIGFTIFFRCLIFDLSFFTNADVVTIKDETSKENS